MARLQVRDALRKEVNNQMERLAEHVAEATTLKEQVAAAQAELGSTTAEAQTQATVLEETQALNATLQKQVGDAYNFYCSTTIAMYYSAFYDEGMGCPCSLGCTIGINQSVEHMAVKLYSKSTVFAETSCIRRPLYHPGVWIVVMYSCVLKCVCALACRWLACSRSCQSSRLR